MEELEYVTVPEMAVPMFDAPPFLYVITNLPAVLVSKATYVCLLFAVWKVYSEPKVIEDPETVPMVARPAFDSSRSL